MGGGGDGSASLPLLLPLRLFPVYSASSVVLADGVLSSDWSPTPSLTKTRRGGERNVRRGVAEWWEGGGGHDKGSIVTAETVLSSLARWPQSKLRESLNTPSC